MLGKLEQMKSSLLDMEKGQASLNLKLDKLIRIHETALPGHQLPPEVQLPLQTLAKVDALEEHLKDPANQTCIASISIICKLIFGLYIYITFNIR